MPWAACLCTPGHMRHATDISSFHEVVFHDSVKESDVYRETIHTRNEIQAFVALAQNWIDFNTSTTPEDTVHLKAWCTRSSLIIRDSDFCFMWTLRIMRVYVKRTTTRWRGTRHPMIRPKRVPAECRLPDPAELALVSRPLSKRAPWLSASSSTWAGSP